MALLIRRDRPFDDLFDLRRDFDRMMNRFVGNLGSSGEGQFESAPLAVPPVNAWVDKKQNQYRISIAMPGIDSKNIQLNVQGNLLTVVGEYQQEQQKGEPDFLTREFYFGRMERSITLPEGVDSDKISAEYTNGILEISAPLSAAALPKKVEIKSLPKAKTAAG